MRKIGLFICITENFEQLFQLLKDKTRRLICPIILLIPSFQNSILARLAFIPYIRALKSS